MATIQALKPCSSISYNTTLNRRRNHFQTITSLNKVTFLNTNNNFNKIRNAIVINHPRSFPPKPVLVSSSRSLRMSAISALTLDDPCLSLRNPTIVMGSYGSSPSVILERPKPELDVKTSKPVLEATVGDFDHNNGDNIGKGNVGGDGKGGGGSGDEDDYFEDFDDEEEGDDEGLFSRRISLPELFDRVFIDAVLSEWQKTLLELPAGIRQACELGAVSSAQLVKYLMNEARPSFTRALHRRLHKDMSREFLGRIMADPSFLHKLLFEQFVTIACSVRSEMKNRKGSSDLQNKLQKLPNNVFEASYRFREFDLQKRVLSFLCKAVQFSLVGFTAGALQSALLHLRTQGKERRLSVPIPPANTNALGYGAFLGLYTNWRYQMIFGMDKLLFNHFNVIGVSLFFTAAFRILNSQLGEFSRTVWLDTESFAPVPPKAQSDNSQKKKKSYKEEKYLQ
uniref:Uncharacterized protein n=1 Tax=Chenopodium quinoa TaxID=63459 RepID=A0A803MGL3_CHEQI